MHFRDKEFLSMYNVTSSNGSKHFQLLTNYCMSHPESSVLLCPYGTTINFINHDAQNPNVKIKWSDFPGTQTQWLNNSIDELDFSSAGLMFEYVAIRDILPNDEILLDYGREWQEAWDAHVKAHSPTIESKGYISASLFPPDQPFRTVKELETNPYPSNLQLHCFYHDSWSESDANTERTVWKRKWENRDYNFGSLTPCNVTLQTSNIGLDGKPVYTVVMNAENDHYEKESSQPLYKLTRVPHRAISLRDTQYSIDTLSPTAFRHSIGIPDEIFPKSWKNFS